MDSEVAHDLRLMRQFLIARNRHMQRLFGRTVRPSATRDELVRIIVLAFSENQLLRVSTSVQKCADYATPPTVRCELALMVESELVLLQADGSNQRSPLIVPTEKLIEFYNHEMPRLREDFKDLLQHTRKGSFMHSADVRAQMKGV